MKARCKSLFSFFLTGSAVLAVLVLNSYTFAASEKKLSPAPTMSTRASAVEGGDRSVAAKKPPTDAKAATSATSSVSSVILPQPQGSNAASSVKRPPIDAREATSAKGPTTGISEVGDARWNNRVSLKAKIPTKNHDAAGPPNKPDPAKVGQGGDNIASATIIAALPYSNTGTTSGFADDYNEICPFSPTGAPDVVYSYTPGSNEVVDIDLCPSSYDTKVYVYENSPATSIGCNDDACGVDGFRSEILGLPLTAGNTYYIVVDGYDDLSFGGYEIDISASTPCVVSCPPGGILEGEACGSDANGGCNSVPEVYGSINCGDTICGTAWADADFRDTDWYLRTFASDTVVTLKAVAEFPVVLFIIDLNSGCAGAAILASANAAACDTAVVTETLPPGTYAFFVGPSVFSGYPCATGPHDYTAWMECAFAPPCVVTCPPGGILEGEPCGSDANGGCNSSPEVYGSVNCGDTICGTAWADADFRDTDWYLKVFPGDTTVTWSGVGEFPIRLFIVNLTSGCAGLSIVGTDFAGPCDTASVTAVLSAGTYAFFAGPDVFNGYPCATGPHPYTARLDCAPPPPAPPNNNCANAIAIGEVLNLPFTNVGATTDGPDEPAACSFFGYTHIESDIWYCYTASCDGAATVSLCGSSYDTKIAVYDGCGCPVSSPPIACNEDFCDFQSEATFVATAGNTYLIRIGGYQGDQGAGFLTVSNPCVPCVACPPGGIAEGEPCGSDLNGGCNSLPEVYGSINCGDTICGTAWADTNSRDTDWYLKVFPGDTTVTWSGVGEFPIRLFIVNLTSGCAGLSIVGTDFAGPCDTASVTAVLSAGTYAFFAGPDVFSGYPCASGPHDYTAWLDCAPPPVGPPNNNCANAAAIGEVLNLPFTNVGATTDGPDEPAACSFFGYTHIESDIWYCYTASCSAPVTVSLCGSSYDTKVAVYNGCVCPVTSPPLACNDDFCALQSELTFAAVAGNKYLIRIGGYQGDQGGGVLTVSCGVSCAVTCPGGGIPEGEACGSDINGGCNSIPPVLGAIECNDTICGTAWADTNSRDTDWYVKTLADSTIVTWGAVAEFPIAVIIADTALGCGNPQIHSFALANACDTAEVTDTLPPGTYIFFVAPDGFSGYSCAAGPFEYVAWLEGNCCPYAKGDMDGNSLLEANDVMLMLNCAFLGSGSCDACYSDMDCSGGYQDATDVVQLLLWVFLGVPYGC